MFDSLGWGEIAVLLVVALFVVGPERLPGVAADAARALRRVRSYVRGMTADLKRDLGPEFQEVDLASLNPRTFVQKHLLTDDDDDLPSGRDDRPSRSTASPPLPPNEQAPWDSDTT